MSTLTCFEYSILRVGQGEFQLRHFQELARLNERHGNSWFTMLDRGVRFTSYVGVIQLPGLLLEILPKTDRAAPNEKRWRRALLEMLRRSGQLPVAAPTVAALAERPLALLELYIRLFIEQCDILLRHGLSKRYRAKTSNGLALKGQLLFAQQLKHNLVHQEHFYTRHQEYDQEHHLHSFLRMALGLAVKVAQGPGLVCRAQALLLHWPEVPPIAVPASRPVLSRQMERYGPALDLALLLLRHLSPDLAKGETQAAALLFDMNRLFEQYVAQQLRSAVAADSSTTVQVQNRAVFWDDLTVRPDLIIKLAEPNGVFILDTKWKVPDNERPAASDLQQLYAYCHLWGAKHAMLLYPNSDGQREGRRATYGASQWLPTTHLEGHCCFLNIIKPDGSLNTNCGTDLLALIEKL
ncbi:McrC family protein [Hymenobacter cellulosivorans]|uniref:McrC family protein n=1 Tax=Hymenobacter cellulosivorans TaxID=2932249 RepID=A0ABY4F2H7_9BACT|nr:McrC family protein [Hymenobacter cellulosivorans]UOQ50689.1 McrC family protein [Hymenobacter cellulosivorans]